MEHALATGEMLVAERDGALAGFASLLTRGAIAYLGDLFVRADCRSGGIGKALLERILPRDGRTLCTCSSADPRALALYVRAGMRPQWPHIWLKTPLDRLSALPPHGLEVQQAQVGDPQIVEWDARVSGRHRPEDHRYLLEGCHAVPLWFLRHGERVGYGYVQMRSDEALRSPEALTLGPIGTLEPADALACACAAVEWARPRGTVLRAVLPGPHPALPVLLDAGFHITYVETFVLSAASPFADPTCYIAPGSGTF